jgi:hypothetical protein
MEIKRAGTQASIKGPEDWFTGTVRIDRLMTAPEPSSRARAQRGTRIRWGRR